LTVDINLRSYVLILLFILFPREPRFAPFLGVNDNSLATASAFTFAGRRPMVETGPTQMRVRL